MWEAISDGRRVIKYSLFVAQGPDNIGIALRAAGPGVAATHRNLRLRCDKQWATGGCEVWAGLPVWNTGCTEGTKVAGTWRRVPTISGLPCVRPNPASPPQSSLRCDKQWATRENPGN